MRLHSLFISLALFAAMSIFPCFPGYCYGAIGVGGKGKSFSIIYSANLKAVITPCG